MDKEKELEAFHSVFGRTHSYDVVAHEKPDFLVKENNKIQLGVEVTEIYSNNTDAKLKNIDGYTSGLIDGTMQVHKRDRKDIKVEEAVLQDKEGSEKREVYGYFPRNAQFQGQGKNSREGDSGERE